LWSGDTDGMLFGAEAAREILAFTLAARESSHRDAPVEMAEFAPPD
jgi:hypothetical protein